MGVRVKDDGQFKEIYVKALDSLPVGAEIDFDGDSANIPDGWEEVDNVLYENADGNNGNITLSDDISNYNYLVITYKNNGNEYYQTAIIPTEYNKFYLTQILEGTTIVSNRYTMSGTTITRNIGYYRNIGSGEYYNTSSWVYIYKIVGKI